MNTSLRTRLWAGGVVGVVLLASCGLGGGTAKKATVTSSPSTNFPTIPVQPTVPTSPPTTPPAGSNSSGGQPGGDPPGIYTIKANDTWYGMAKNFGVDVQALLDAQDPPATLKTHIDPGMKIVLPESSATSPTSSGTSSGGTSGGSSSSSPSTTSSVKAVGTYTVVAKDYWIGIAKKLNVQLNDLLAVNNATADTRLDPGKVIKVPAKRKA